jgi:hypothetical protein
MLGLARMAAKMAAKKFGKEAVKKSDDIPVPNFYELRKAKEAEKAKDLLKERVAIGAATVGAIPVAAKMGSLYGEQLNEKTARMKEESEKPPKEESEEKSYKRGGKISSASKRADGCAIKGKTRGKMV